MNSADKVLAVLKVDPGGGSWDIRIGTTSPENTVCFEASFDNRSWFPISGRRVYGPGPKMGNIITNAVAGGPALFEGTHVGVHYLRVIQTRSDGTAVRVELTSTNPFVMYIINEETTLEDALNSS